MLDFFDDFEVDYKAKVIKAHRCEGCKSCKKVDANDFSFLGCFHKPYRGKWIAEIKECPMSKENEE